MKTPHAVIFTRLAIYTGYGNKEDMSKQRRDPREESAALAADAAIHFHNGRYSQALEMFDRAIALDDTNVRAFGGRSLVMVQLGQPAAAIHNAELALGLDPSYAPNYTVLAYCYHRLGREKEAQETFEKALALQPNEPRVLYNYACYWAELRDEEKCRTYLERAFHHVAYHTLEHAPNDPDLAIYAKSEWFRELLAKAKQARRNRRGPEETPGDHR